MNTLIIFLLTISLPLAFILHDGEETLLLRRWMKTHGKDLAEQFPKFSPIITHLGSLSTKAFAIAALEELFVIAIVTYYTLTGGDYCFHIWYALFIAFSFHLLIHICQAIVVRGYVPGLITSLLLAPYAFLVLCIIGFSMEKMEITICGFAGIVFMAANLAFAHWIGRFLTRPKNGTKK